MKPGLLAVVCGVCVMVGALVGYWLAPIAERSMQGESQPVEPVRAAPTAIADGVEKTATGPRNVAEIGALALALGSADKGDVMDTLAVAVDITDPVARLETMTVAYSRLAELDPQEALEHALRNGGAANSPWAQEWIRRIFGTWAAQDFDAAVAAFQRLPFGVTATAISATLSARPELTEDERIELVRHFGYTTDVLHSLGSTMVRIADDPAAVFADMPMSGSVWDARQSALFTWALRDPRAAMEAARALRRDYRARDYEPMIAAVWALSEAEAALEWALTESSEAQRASTIARVVGVIANSDPVAALDAANGLTGEQRAQAVSMILNTLLTRDEDAAIDLLAGEIDPVVRARTVEAFAWTISGRDPVRAAEWADTLAASEQQRILPTIAASIASERPGDAIDLLGRIENQDSRVEAAKSVASAWTFEDPAAAFEWAATAEEPLRDAALQTVFEFWPMVDYDAAVEQLRTLDDEGDYDLAAEGLMRYQSEPTLLEEVHGRISDAELKATTAAKLMAILQRNDPVGAQAFADRNGLSN